MAESAANGRRPQSLGAVLRKLIFDLLRKTPRVLFIYLVLFSGAGYCGAWHRYLELTSHFRLQYFVVSCAFAALFAALRAWRWAVAGLLCMLLNGVVIVPWYFSGASVKADAESYHLRLLLANIHFANTNYAGVIAMARAEKPDVMILQELTPLWAEQLQSVRDLFPHAQINPGQDPPGIALYSRLPLDDVRVLTLGSVNGPSIFAKIKVGAVSVSLLTTHPPPPMAGYAAYRNEQLRLVASYARDMPRPAVLIADLNTTMWSPYYSQLVRESGLVDARKGFGVLPTWPAPLKSSLLMIPIDHCLVSPDLQVTGTKQGPDIDSDHLPLIVDLLVPKAAHPSNATHYRVAERPHE